MNENVDKKLDNLSRKVMGNSVVESPSVNFTQNLMSQIISLNTSKVTTYVPLISKRVWLLIAVAFLGVLGYLIIGTSGEQNTSITDYGLDRIFNMQYSNPLSSVEFSQTLIYAVALFAIMLCIQIPILKRHFDKRFEA